MYKIMRKSAIINNVISMFLFHLYFYIIHLLTKGTFIILAPVTHIPTWRKSTGTRLMDSFIGVSNNSTAKLNRISHFLLCEIFLCSMKTVKVNFACTARPFVVKIVIHDFLFIFNVFFMGRGTRIAFSILRFRVILEKINHTFWLARWGFRYKVGLRSWVRLISRRGVDPL